MRLNELKKLVQETVRAEQTKGTRKGRRTSNASWNRIVENTIRTVLKEEASVADFRSKDIPLKLSDVDSAKQVIEEKTGKTGEEAIKESAQLFVDNVTNCPTAKNPPGDFPQRKDMPVIDDEFVTEPGISNATKTAMDALTKGKLDITDTEGPKDGEYMKESINIRRWNKLAGILKG